MQSKCCLELKYGKCTNHFHILSHSVNVDQITAVVNKISSLRLLNCYHLLYEI